MGNFYTQILVRGPSVKATSELLRRLGRTAFISPDLGGWILVLDAKTEDQNIDDLDDLAFTIAHELEARTIGVLNHDDDHLIVRLFDENGYICDVDGWASCSKFKHFAEIRKSVFSVWLAFEIPSILKIFRHQKICRLLDIPEWVAGVGFRYVSDSNTMPGVPLEILERV